MAKTLLISSLIAACSLAVAAPQASDAPGVTVTLNGAAVLHRTGVGYPPAALRDGVQGTVSVQLKLDSTGEVSDAEVLTGPQELRKAALESVLQWHFAQDAAGSTRVIQIAFEAPKTEAVPNAAVLPKPPAPVVQQGSIMSIQVEGLSEQASAQLLATLPIHVGGQWDSDTAERARQALQAFDEHLTVRQQSMIQHPDGTNEVGLVIAADPQRIKVGGNVQSAMILRKTPPIYPAAAKAAHVSGIVHLAAIVGKDGAVQELHVLGGPPELIQAAMDAVKTWVYRPTLLNGNPVQVETTIDINFTLNQ
jgi:TonB family protein